MHSSLSQDLPKSARLARAVPCERPVEQLVQLGDTRDIDTSYLARLALVGTSVAPSEDAARDVVLN